MYAGLYNNTNYNSSNMEHADPMILIVDPDVLPLIDVIEVTEQEEIIDQTTKKVKGIRYVINDIYEFYIKNDNSKGSFITIRGYLKEDVKIYTYLRLYQIITNESNVVELDKEQMKIVSEWVDEFDKDSCDDKEIMRLVQSMYYINQFPDDKAIDIILEIPVSYEISKDTAHFLLMQNNIATKSFASLDIRKDCADCDDTKMLNSYSKMRFKIANNIASKFNSVFEPIIRFIVEKSGYSPKSENPIFINQSKYVQAETKKEMIWSTIETSISAFTESKKKVSDPDYLPEYLGEISDFIGVDRKKDNQPIIKDVNKFYKTINDKFIMSASLNPSLKQLISSQEQQRKKSNILFDAKLTSDPEIPYIYTGMIRYLAFGIKQLKFNEYSDPSVIQVLKTKNSQFKEQAIFKLSLSNSVLSLLDNNGLLENFISQLDDEEDIKYFDENNIEDKINKWLGIIRNEKKLLNNIRYVNGGLLYNLFVTLSNRGFTEFTFHVQPTIRCGSIQGSNSFVKVTHNIKLIDELKQKVISTRTNVTTFDEDEF